MFLFTDIFRIVCGRHNISGIFLCLPSFEYSQQQPVTQGSYTGSHTEWYGIYYLTYLVNMFCDLFKHFPLAFETKYSTSNRQKTGVRHFVHLNIDKKLLIKMSHCTMKNTYFIL